MSRGDGKRLNAIQSKDPRLLEPVERYIVLERSPLLEFKPPAEIFQNPPFNIRRPGAYSEDGHIHFAVHAPGAARLRVIGPWTNWEQNAVEMRSTLDGAIGGHVFPSMISRRTSDAPIITASNINSSSTTPKSFKTRRRAG